MTLVCLPVLGFTQPIKVHGVWGFTPASTQGTYVRNILEESNKIQKKYEFIFEHKPGAGSTIAAKNVLERKNTILANSAAQFVRPYLYPETSWNFSDFKPVMIMGINPAVLVSSGKSIDEIIRQPKINLATAGTGSSTHLMAEVFAKEVRSKFPGKDIAMVHFKDTNEAFMSVMGGHTDATFEFYGDARAKAISATRFLGLTGPRSIDGVPTMRSLGYTEVSGVQGIFAWYAPADMPEEQLQEFQKIFQEAEKAESVQRLYRSDYATKDTSINLNKWYEETVRRFKSYTQGITVN